MFSSAIMPKHLLMEMWTVLLSFIFFLYLLYFMASELFWVFKNLSIGWFYILCFHFKAGEEC